MSRDLVALVKLYEEAANRHNLEAVASLFSEDAQYELVGQDVLHGKDEVTALHAYDAGIGTHLDITQCAVQGDTVTCRIVEHNEWLVAGNLSPIVYETAAFHFEGNRIGRMIVTMDEEKIDEIAAVLQAFMPWLFEAHPAEAEQIFTPSGDFVYNRANGEMVVQLLREWREGAGRQG